MTLLESVFRGFVGAGLASIGFAILFNIRGKNIWFAGLTGALGGLAYNLLVYYGCNAVLANFYAVLVLAGASEILARILNCTVSTFMACGLIPLVPGGDAYRMMDQFLNENIYSGLQYGLEMITIASMLVLGILIVAVLTRFILYIKGKFFHRKVNKDILDELN